MLGGNGGVQGWKAFCKGKSYGELLKSGGTKIPDTQQSTPVSHGGDAFLRSYKRGAFGIIDGVGPSDLEGTTPEH